LLQDVGQKQIRQENADKWRHKMQKEKRNSRPS